MREDLVGASCDCDRPDAYRRCPIERLTRPTPTTIRSMSVCRSNVRRMKVPESGWISVNIGCDKFYTFCTSLHTEGNAVKYRTRWFVGGKWPTPALRSDLTRTNRSATNGAYSEKFASKVCTAFDILHRTPMISQIAFSTPWRAYPEVSTPTGAEWEFRILKICAEAIQQRNTTT